MPTVHTQQFKHAVALHVAFWVDRLTGLGVQQLEQRRKILCNDLSWAQPLIHQTANDAQSLDLFHRINTLTRIVPLRVWKTITSLPNTQGILTDACVTLYLGDAQAFCHAERTWKFWFVHFVCDKHIMKM